MKLNGISIIIVNYNSFELVLNLLESIKQNSPQFDTEIIVVDNNSAKINETTICEAYSNVVWIQNEENLGFGIANNKGIDKAKYDTVLLLNPDTIGLPNSLSTIATEFWNANSTIGMGTCQLLNEDGSPQKSTYSKNGEFSELFRWNIAIAYIFRKRFTAISEDAPIKALSGACLIFSKERLSSIGLFDPDFFMYSEEFEWCHRIRKAGFKLVQFKQAKIIHLEEASSPSKKWNRAQRFTSIALLFKKRHHFPGVLLYLAILKFNMFTNFLLLWKMDKPYRSNYWLDVKIHFSLIPTYFKIIFGLFQSPLKVTKFRTKKN